MIVCVLKWHVKAILNFKFIFGETERKGRLSTVRWEINASCPCGGANTIAGAFTYCLPKCDLAEYTGSRSEAGTQSQAIQCGV